MRNNCVDSKPQDMSWGDILGENMDGYLVYEGTDCPECGEEFVAVGVFRGHECPECNKDIEVEIGPQMNYFYAVDIGDCVKAAKKIAHLPLCVVELDDGTTGIALTGGGMDLSWEICDAFISLGFLPPVHFARLPEMSGWEKDGRSKRILEACLQSAKMAARWAEVKAGHCREMLAKMQAVEANEKADQ